MAEQEPGSDDARLAAIARHALHDEELIAAFAAGDLDGTHDAERAHSLVERCATCRELHRDLTSIRVAVRASGSATQRSATVAAPRDFRLSAEDAARLRPGSPVERVAARLGFLARLDLGIVAFGRPVGAAMATLGVAGLLIGSLTLGGVPSIGLGGSAAASAAPAANQGPEVQDSRQAPEASTARTNYGPFSTPNDTKAGAQVLDGRSGGTSTGTIALLAGSIGLLAIGLGLIWASRRNRATVRAPEGN